MNGLSQVIIEKHIQREHKILDYFIEKRGINVTVKPPSILDSNNSPKHQTLDDFEINIQRVSTKDEYLTTKEYKTEDEFTTKLIFEVSSSFGDFNKITDGEMISYLQGNNTPSEIANNFDLLYAYIKCDKIIPIGSIIIFNDFQEMNFIVSNIEKKRQLTKVFRYTLSRT